MGRFVAIDLETASEARDSACAMGWALVDDGVIAESGWTPIDPEIRPGAWSDFNTTIHGLTLADVRGAPNFAAAWPALATLAAESPLVAHYASFD